jgi:hypothetical protein
MIESEYSDSDSDTLIEKVSQFTFFEKVSFCLTLFLSYNVFLVLFYAEKKDLENESQAKKQTFTIRLH